LFLKPFKNEVLEGVVASINKMGFFANIGPLQVFVSSHLIQSQFQFDAVAVPPCYVDMSSGGGGGGGNMDRRIGPGDVVRLKVIGTRLDASEIVAIGSIKEDYLGVL
jgi:DNA-directed RNA polymerase II subunit RPB7